MRQQQIGRLTSKFQLGMGRVIKVDNGNRRGVKRPQIAVIVSTLTCC